ncbi:hypothetical protein FSARC_4577 [Fusarium sarcochroum]|uniref:RING-type domain-containing protein n=1 Tax=Fusarium sarcochroum TaxID=1208366 RepID=A0A8H4U192_9HYPO|nr:hypothetical protein FSARC_4577 [Fusarium sarcochroum]
MAAAVDSEMQHIAVIQLDYLLEWEQANRAWPSQDVPQDVQDLQKIRPHLEAMAAGHTPANHATTDRSVPGALRNYCSNDFVAQLATPAAAAASAAIARATASRTNGEPEEDTYSDDKVKVPLETAVEARKARITPAINALSFLSEAAVGHIRNSKARQPSQSPLPQDTVNEPENKGPKSSNIQPAQLQAVVEATDIDKWEPSPAFPQDDEEDLISFEILPSRAATLPLVQVADEVSLPDADDEENAEPAHCDDGYIAHFDEGAPASLSGEEHRSSSNMAGNEDAKCIKCGDECMDTLIKCPCIHHYCSDCLCDLVKSSIRDEVTFPPTCCDLQVPINANSNIFSGKILLEFLTKKYGNGSETPDVSPDRHNLNNILTPPKEDGH